MENKTGNPSADMVAQEGAQTKKPNRLIHEKSPYLLQHAFNPINWYPWSEEAFEKARREDKPIFLSIGYSTCHWCHVMAHESFENPEIAAILNRYFVAIKVDREERPDLDHIYMSATQAMSGSGGWPMSLFLLPDRRPFYAGTYFPPDSKFGRPGFRALLEAVHKAWSEDRNNIIQSADKITSYLVEENQATPASSPRETLLTPDLLEKGFLQLSSRYDMLFGGFGEAPKFPTPVTFNFLLRYAKLTANSEALEMAAATLEKMAEGGVYDQIGGGFHRYSVDRQWRVPHFEKMLYDQAQLAASYLEAYQATQKSFFAQTADGILDYVLRDMTSAEGGFYSAEDADSPSPDHPTQQGEGEFYTWTAKQLADILAEPEAKLFSYRFGVKEHGNALADPHGEFADKNILFQSRSIRQTSKEFNKTAEETEALLEKSRQVLFNHRLKRPRPHLDNKIITSWNGLMISGMAKGYQVLSNDRYLRAAERSAEFIYKNLFDSQRKILYRHYASDPAEIEAFLEDYVFLVQGLLDLYEASLEFKWFEWALALTEKQIELFGDPQNGGFWDSSAKDDSLLFRTKIDYDGALPAGNSIAALNLLRLGYMTNREDFHQKALSTISAFAKTLENRPAAMQHMLAVISFGLEKPSQIIIAGNRNSSDTLKMLAAISKRFNPNKIILLAENGESREKLSQYIPVIDSMRMIDGMATAYVCKNFTCKQPTTSPTEVISFLEK